MSKRSRNARAGAARPGGRQPATNPARSTPAAAGRRQPQRRQSRVLPLALGAAAIVGAAILAIVLSQSGDTSPRPSSAGGSAGSSGGGVVEAPTVSGGALAAYSADVQDPAVGQPIPDVSGTAFDGSPVSIVRDGTPKLLLFLAHWCPHCREEVPKVQDWLDANGLPEGVDFVSVATSIDQSRPNYPPDGWLASEGWTPPVLVDSDDSVATAFGLSAFPYWVAVNGDGTVAQRWTGSVDTAQLGALFDGLRATAPSAEPSANAAASGS